METYKIDGDRPRLKKAKNRLMETGKTNGDKQNYFEQTKPKGNSKITGDKLKIRKTSKTDRGT